MFYQSNCCRKWKRVMCNNTAGMKTLAECQIWKHLSSFTWQTVRSVWLPICKNCKRQRCKTTLVWISCFGRRRRYWKTRLNDPEINPSSSTIKVSNIGYFRPLCEHHTPTCFGWHFYYNQWKLNMILLVVGCSLGSLERKDEKLHYYIHLWEHFFKNTNLKTCENLVDS